MISKDQLKKISGVIWEIPQSFRSDMRVPVRVFATSKMLDEILGDKSLEQGVNVATLPGVGGAVLVMPDVHEGYGFPIGGVAAMEYPQGVISPGGIGYDINCGVRLLTSSLRASDLGPHKERIAQELYQHVPSGVGRGGFLKLGRDELNQVLREGIAWAISKGYATSEDADRIESRGKLPDADPAQVSDKAKLRGRDQLGTMGAGNHFVEVQRVEEIFAEDIARSLGLFANQVVILIHCGSRGLGHQIATDYIRLMLNKTKQYQIKLVDPELACAPFSSPEGKNYFAAMSAAANFAWVNRQLITHQVRQVWQEVLGSNAGKLSILYDVSHNIAKIEEHEIDGQRRKVIIHRKGATRAFPDQPVLIPGSMGTASYVLVGTSGAMQNSFGSTCHGAGRRMSRTRAKKEVRGEKLRQELESQGITVQAGSLPGLAEEAPLAYKNVDEVVEVVSLAGIARKVARLRPLAVIKG